MPYFQISATVLFVIAAGAAGYWMRPAPDNQHGDQVSQHIDQSVQIASDEQVASLPVEAGVSPKSRYLTSCEALLKNDSGKTCLCMYQAHIHGGANAVTLMAEYYEGKRELMNAVGTIFANQPKSVSNKMSAALKTCPNQWTPEKGWH